MIGRLDGAYIRLRPAKAISRLVGYGLFEGRPLTARGRWLNILVSGFLRVGKRLPELRGVGKPIFIVGTGRSGTTVLGLILSMHRDVGFLNEPKALWHAIYPEEDLIGSYTLGPARYRLSAGDATDEVRDCARRLFGAYLALTGSRRLVDKYPELIFRVPFVRAIFPGAKFIFLVRNCWDTCRSIEEWSRKFGIQLNGEVHDWWGLNRRKWNFLVDQLVQSEPDLACLRNEVGRLVRDVEMAAVEWIVTMREGMRWMRESPNEIHMVRYEELTKEPDQCLSRILRFCELYPERVVFEYAQRVLRRVSSGEGLDLHPVVSSVCREIMKGLGYAV